MKNKKNILIAMTLSIFIVSCDALIEKKDNTSNVTPSPSASVSPALEKPKEEAPKPVNIDDFIQKYSAVSKPEDIPKMFLDAIHGYFDPSKKERSAAIIGILINAPSWETQAGSLSFFRMKLADMQYIFRSYAKGSSPENNYQMDSNNYEIEITKSEIVDANTQKIFIKSSGADSPRPITLKKDKSGLWTVYEFSSLYVDVRKPA